MDLRHKLDALRSHPASLWLHQVNELLPNVLTWLLLVVAAWYLARLIWAFVPLYSDFDWTARPQYATRTMPAGGSAQIDFPSIANAHLFGEAGAEPVNTAIDAPETQLNLQLRGTIAAGDETMAHAIIADGDGKDKVFFINDTLPGGAVLHEVYTDRVILNRGGVLEALRLPRISKALGRQSVPGAAPPFGDQNSVAAPDAMQQMMQADPASFTDILRPQPYMPNGELKGYRVYPGRDRRRFAALGLRPGDLVTAINGQALDNLQSGMEVFRNLGNAAQIAVTIERNGAPMTLTLDTNQVVESQEAGE
jgi:general secretion pathway protein C